MNKYAEIIIDTKTGRGTISPRIYGHFTEHIGGVFYDGLWVGEDSKIANIRGFRKALVESFKRINPAVVRWPGGCFAELYDWRDGIGPRENRPERAGWWYSYDHRTEKNQVGTHEFMDFCRMVGAEPYIAANMTTTTPLHIRNWIEYCNFPENSTTLARERAENGDKEPFNVSLWGIGNENWGGGGQMSPEMNMDEFMRYSTICNSLDNGKLKFIFCGANAHDVEWTRRCFEHWNTRKWHDIQPFGMSVHYYCGTAGNPQDFTDDQWYEMLFKADFMRKMVADHRAAMDEFDPERKIGLIVDEWGCWHKDGTGPSKGYNLFEQQSCMRDAVVTAMTLNIFNNNCDVVAMANVAQLCNNLHSLYLAGGENFVETPNYHVFDMFKFHQGARQLNTIPHCEKFEREGYSPLESVSVSASEKDGYVNITMANIYSDSALDVKLGFLGENVSGVAVVTTLYSDDLHTCNTFENPTAVTPVTETRKFACGDTVSIPAGAVMAIRIKR